MGLMLAAALGLCGPGVLWAQRPTTAPSTSQGTTQAFSAAPLGQAGEQAVDVIHLPEGAVQPQVQVDAQGRVDVIYFKGDAAHGDIYFSRLQGTALSPPIRVNSQPQSAVAAGRVRGPQLAVGRNGRVYVAWNGSSKAEPKAPGDATPMLFTRMNDAGDGFEPQRNVISKHAGLDGGGSVAADQEGNVYIAWHAPRGKDIETDRWVWIARSADDGRTFAPEVAANPQATGACGCCGVTIAAQPGGKLLILYRSATELIHRDIYLLASDDYGASFHERKVSSWEINMCPMTTASIATGAGQTIAAWETRGQIDVGRVDPTTDQMTDGLTLAGKEANRKHPRVAINAHGDYIVAWAEGTGWQKGGSAAWQIFDRSGQPRTKQMVQANVLPVWDTVAVFAGADGRFRIVY